MYFFFANRQSRHKRTVDKLLLLLRQDAGQVGAVKPALPLRSVPGATVRKVLVAVRLELVPAEATNLSVWEKMENKRNTSLVKNCNSHSESS